MARLSPRSGSGTNRPSTAADGAGPESTPWRSLLLALGIAALAYVALRWYREGAKRAMDRLPEPIVDEAETVLEGAQSIEIGTPGEETTADGRSASEDSETEDGDRENDGETGEVGETEDSDEREDGDTERDEEPSLDAVLTADRSSDEIAGLAEPDVKTKPAEPGTMTVEDEIADEVIDELEDDEPEDNETEDGDEREDGKRDEENDDGAESNEERDE